MLRYFLRHPRATDDFEGIARWRLRDEALRPGIREVEQALAWLVEQGFLVERSTIGRPPVFSINAERMAQAERFLVAAQRRSSKRERS